MKLSTSTFILATLIVLGNAKFAQAQDISTGKAAELACHRVERLVTLKKIDASFLLSLHTVDVVSLTQTKPTDPAFKAIVSEYPGPDGTANQVEIFLDLQGKPLSNNVVPGTPPAGNPQWTDKDPVTLTENSLHYVLDGWSADPRLKPFFSGFKNLELTQIKDGQGQVLARVEMHSVETSSVLEVFIKPDGTFQSATIRP